MDKTVGIILAVGLVGIAGFFIYRSTSQASDSCSGSWTDYINPFCIAGSAAASASNEVNTVLIIVGLVVVLVVGLLAFGPATGHIAGAASKFAIL